MKWLENLTGGYSSSAKVVNDTLILSLPDAKSPIVWRMELGSIKAAAFELQQKDSDYMLVMKTPKGEPQQIAPFDSRAKALKALMSASQAMEQAQILSKNVANDSDGKVSVAVASSGKSRGGQALAGLVGIVILGSLLFILTQLGARGPAYTAGAAGGAAQQSGTAPGGGPAGVPMSAEDFLMQR